VLEISWLQQFIKICSWGFLVISSLNGIVQEISANSVTVEVGGVGYLVSCSMRCLENLQLGATSKLIVYTDVREDAISLYGFKDKIERQVFQLLKTVKGIGSRTALEVLSQLDPLDLLRAIGSGDITRLKTLKGVGKKTAERIIVELKEKVGEFAVEQTMQISVDVIAATPIQDAEAALMALGFSQQLAAKALRNVLSQQSEANNSGLLIPGYLVREALKYV